MIVYDSLYTSRKCLNYIYQFLYPDFPGDGGECLRLLQMNDATNEKMNRNLMFCRVQIIVLAVQCI